MNKRTLNAWIKKLDKSMKGIAKERDLLDSLISEAEDLRENCDTAWNNLQDARDGLSEMV